MKRKFKNTIWLLCKKCTLAAILFMLSFTGNTVAAQTKNVGLPYISNFSREQYQAGTQNWSIAQDNYGLLYYANNDGVLRFDGSDWKLYPLPNNSIVRVVSSIENKIYAGGFDEFGYFEYTAQGKFKYTSLSDKLDDGSKEFGEIWRIYSTRYGIVFQSYKGVFLLQDNKLITIKPKSTFGFSYLVNNNFFVVDRKYGLFVLQGRVLNPIIKEEQFFQENEIPFVFSAGNQEYLIGTNNNGVYIYDGQELSPWNTKLNKHLIENQIYTAIELQDEELAIGTIQDGVFIADKQGNIHQHVNRFKGLQNNTVLSLLYDNSQNLWVGLDNGIDYLEISSPISLINYCYNIETAYATVVHNNLLYIGTNQGLFAKEISLIKNEYSLDDGFRLIDGTQGQVWSLKVFGGELFCGHNYGTFLVDGFRVNQISETPGAWDFITLPGEQKSIIAGTYEGLVLFNKPSGTNSQYTEKKIEGFNESSRIMMVDETGAVWVSHAYKGLFRLEISEDLSRIETYNLFSPSEYGLPSLPYTFAKIKGQSFLVTSNGLYTYNIEKDTFSFNAEINRILGNVSHLTKVYEDYFGDLWYFTNTGCGVHRLQEDGSYTHITIPFHRLKGQFLTNSYENVYTYDRRNIFIGGQKGMFHYDQMTLKNFDANYTSLLRSVKILKSEKDSVLHSIYGFDPDKQSKHTFTFPYKYNSVSFQFTAPFYEALNHTEYSFRLQGFDTKWSDWSSRNEKEYTNLHEGDYVFELKAKNIYGKESDITYFTFTVQPPLFRSTAAYIVYSAILMLVIVLNAIYFKRRVEKARRAEKLKHEKVLYKTERKFKEEVKQSEEKIEKLKNDKLVSDMRHKNMELANATMHLIQKNKFMTKLKGDLMRMWGEAQVDSVKSDIKQIVRKIDKDFKNEQHWKVFDKYFDEVHQDFIQRIKEKHTILTPNDLRLCAYLRMNLSTKEIAPLMNISVRGLEISRYRLRKKLELEREVNLIDYIMEI
jgi:ligand-binding sensor domain-containing protein/DNA-binding CsgD family transcriptional regulator